MNSRIHDLIKFSDHADCHVDMYQKGSKKRARKTGDDMI